jgi:hypothetical protein
VLTINALVKAPIYISPGFVYLRGPADRKLSRTVSVKAGEEQSLTLKEAGSHLGTRVTYAIEEVEAGKLFTIHFTTIPGLPGTYRGLLKLNTNYPEMPQIIIPVRARLHHADKPQKGRRK